ncbi:MAG: Rpp14/Pop5 family protein [Candidatus Woesearchaeota archaeon]
MATLLPTLRERKQYLAFEVIADKELSWESTRKAVTMAIKNYIGLEGMSHAGIMFVKNNKNKGIMKIQNNYLTKVRAALLFIKEIDNQKVVVKSIRASGMLNKLHI